MSGPPPQDDRSSRSTRTSRGDGHDAVPQPRTGGRGGLPPRAGRAVVRPGEPARVVDEPAPAGALTSSAVLSPASATIGSVPRWDEGPLVGRAEELARLMAHVDRAGEGRPSAVLVAGDAGVGKTRLLDELSRRAAERGVRVLTGHCVDLGDVGLPYLPFVDLLRPVAVEPELAPAAVGNPVLAAMLAGRPGAFPPVAPAF